LKTLYVVSEAGRLGNGAVMVSGTITEGPRLAVGQRGFWQQSPTEINVEVIGIGVVDPNLEPKGRQGLLLRVEGEIEKLKSATLCFGEKRKGSG
jgi:hypothetical protein